MIKKNVENFISEKIKSSKQKIFSKLKEKDLQIKGLNCEECGEGYLNASIAENDTEIEIVIKCSNCDYNYNMKDIGIMYQSEIKDSYKDNLSAAKEKSQIFIETLSDSLKELKNQLPKDKKELAKVIKDPSHPFTASLLAALLIILMEATGFGIYMALTWILGTFILNPVSWFLIPIIVGVVFANRKILQKNSVIKIKDDLDKLRKDYNNGNLSAKEYHKLVTEKIRKYDYKTYALKVSLEDGNFSSNWIDEITSKEFQEKYLIIKDEEHLEYLKNVFKDAEKEIFIFSGWLSERLFEKYYENILSALKNNVSINIIYGYEKSWGKKVGENNNLNALNLIDTINNRPDISGTIKYIKIPNHQKILICDNKYVICGSANWLNNLNYSNKETSIMINDKEIIKKFKADAKRLFDK